MERVIEARQYAQIYRQMDTMERAEQRPSGPLADLWDDFEGELLEQQFAARMRDA